MEKRTPGTIYERYNDREGRIHQLGVCIGIYPLTGVYYHTCTHAKCELARTGYITVWLDAGEYLDQALHRGSQVINILFLRLDRTINYPTI